MNHSQSPRAEESNRHLKCAEWFRSARKKRLGRMWGSAIACKCFCATWHFPILCSPLPKSRDSVCDVLEFLTEVRNTAHLTCSGSASVLTLTPSLLLKSHPMVMLKPVQVSQNGERRILRMLWFQRYSRTHCPWRIWSWKTWKGYMGFGQRRKPNAKPAITDALGTPNYLGPLYCSFSRNTQTHLCEGDIALFNYLPIKI